MVKNKKVIILLIILIVSVIGAIFIITRHKLEETPQEQPLVSELPIPTVKPTPPPSGPTSSKLGKTVNYPNDHEGWVSCGWLDSYVIGQYSMDQRNYSGLLADAEVAAKIASVVDPALTAAKENFPNAQVGKSIYNGFMTVTVNEELGKRASLYEPEGYEVPYYGDPVFALNFDLHTGEKIDLRAVFADDFDAQAAVDKAVQPYVLMFDEQNVRKFRGVDMQNTGFVIDENGIWLIFDDKSPFLTGKSIYIEWYKFGEGAIAVFDRFALLSESEISDQFEEKYGAFYSEKFLYKSEPKYQFEQNAPVYLPVNYENEYELELAEKVKQIALLNKYEDGLYEFWQTPRFDRIGKYRVIYAYGYNNGTNETQNLSGIFDIQSKREITMAEYYGSDYEFQIVSEFHRELNEVLDEREKRFALVTDERLLELLKSAEFDAVDGCITFAENICYTERYYEPSSYQPEGYTHRYDSSVLYVESKIEWWK